MLNLHRFDSDVLKNETEEFGTVQRFTQLFMSVIYVSITQLFMSQLFIS